MSLMEEKFPSPLDATSVSEGWLRACQLIRAAPGHTMYYLLVRIHNPLQRRVEIDGPYDAFCQARRLPCLEGVASTIFPETFYRFHCSGNVERLFEGFKQYRKKVGMIFRKQLDFSYFDRLIHWQPVGAAPVNQLAIFIERMNEYRYRYEAWYFYPTIDPTRDLRKIRGGPCLSAVDVKYERDRNRLHLFAFYRDHDFESKALGNYIGLCDLQRFLCEQIGAEVGALHCFSLRARIGGLAPREFRTLLDELSVLVKPG